MTKGKNTKRALLTSVLSMLLCCAMLVGSTFAWFTDSVTSGKNKIVAGNLDVELEYSYDGENWETVTETTNLFKSADETLWEPGHTEYAYLRVRNAGKLALKYKFDIKVFGDEEGNEENTYTNVDGKPFKLSDYLVFNKTQGAAEIGKREDLWLKDAAEEAAAMGKLNGLGGTGALFPEASEVMTLAVYMPTSVGNEANQLTSARATEGEPTIYLGLDLIATQAVAESDSFGNDYDAKADGTPNWENVTISTATAHVDPDSENTLISTELVSVSVKNTAADGDTLVLKAVPTDTPDGITVNADQMAQAYEISVQGLKKDNTEPIPVSMFVGKNLINVELYHYNEKVEDAEYNSATGIIYFETTSFSPFTVVSERPCMVSTADELKNAIVAGKNIMLTDDVEFTSTLYLKNASFTLNGNGHTITQADDCQNNIALLDINGGSASISNVTFDGIKGGAVIRTVYAELKLDKVTVENCQHTQIQGLLRLLGKSTITNSTFKNNNCSMAVTFNFDDDSNNDPQIVKNCVFEGNNCNGTALLYYVSGSGAAIDGNKFMNNTVTSTGNVATVYMGFTENNVITNNVFSGNNVTTSHATTKRATGGLMIGYEATITGNAFVDNTITVEGRKLGNDVCASVYYTNIDLSGNYWGGKAPVENDDYFVEYPDQNTVIINDYLTTYGN